MPEVNTECMNIFLENMSKYLSNQTSIIVMDRASWHRSKDLKVPSNIKIILLPPYSPELNPVERLWRHIIPIPEFNIVKAIPNNPQHKYS